ncbi:glyceraldehyde-3-phosphate dehydrogenase (NADP+) [Alteribacillus persepolensis]|uniref:Glyceraldehyde-3-phosphate dehydrogenase (NADP+) n=1 Tax=Alteribacillus persepolensis TaxID=568899 RepID=A0A1G7ZB60_9BACI|nr:aldehyde dehydrogenase family protein [Alteribacillus persepolensis]SDH05350.1 glyceraldehyde-3-phosphate dehydrogenase (NADP+) [Alteribacillus persepolensis]
MATKLAGKKMLIAGEWEEREDKIEVYNPENNELIDTVPAAKAADIEKAIALAKQGAKVASDLSIRDRMNVLNKAASFIEKNIDKFATTIALEGSKTINEARSETARAAETLRLSAEEARRLNGESINFDQMPGQEDRMGYYFRFPVGVVAAITPFNDPLNLVAHKLGPAIAAGNAVILKPAAQTPLSALKLAEALMNAGLPKKILTVITGRGRDIGDTLVESKDVQMISFTGGLETGEQIAKKAGLKKLSMELGSNSPVIIRKDADLNLAADAAASGAFSAAGQNCLSVQRIFIEEDVYEVFKEAFLKKVKKLKVGHKLSESTDMGPLINEKEAIRVENWIREAVSMGGTVLRGGTRKGAYLEPTVLEHVPEKATIVKEEVFGPAVMLFKVKSLDEAIERANNVNYGLQAGIFTANINSALKAAKKLHVGGVMVNDSSDFRIDAMPFGGVKGSGLGREGVAFAIREMSEERIVGFKLTE